MSESTFGEALETYMLLVAASEPMPTLENPSENPCFGCGPNHARGLRLSFERQTAADGVEEVSCTYTPKPDEIGWPGLFHISLLFAVLMETSYWAALTLGGRVMTVRGPVAFEAPRLPRVGRTFRARARLLESAGQEPGIECVAEDANGRLHATMTTSWQRASRARVEKAGITLPDYLLEDMDP